MIEEGIARDILIWKHLLGESKLILKTLILISYGVVDRKSEGFCIIALEERREAEETERKSKIKA